MRNERFYSVIGITMDKSVVISLTRKTPALTKNSFHTEKQNKRQRKGLT